MTAAEGRARAAAQRNLERLLTGWAGALLSGDDLETRRKAREASAAARRAMAQGATPYQALLEHIVPVFKTGADG